MPPTVSRGAVRALFERDSANPKHIPVVPAFARLAGMALILATLCNGAGFYLRKMGFIEPEAYRAYWALHCEKIAYVDTSGPAGPGCCAHATAEEGLRLSSKAHRSLEHRFTGYLYDLSQAEIALKLVKDLLGAALIAVSAFLIARRRTTLPSVRAAWPLQLLLGYVLVSFVISWATHGAMSAAVGLRPFMFVAIGLTGRWLAPHMPLFAKCAAVLLVTEALLIPMEMLYGIHLHGHLIASPHLGFYSLASRASGTLVLPNSMGVFAVAALAFYYAFSPTRAFLPMLTTTALALTLVSGSATGIVCAMLFLFLIFIERVDEQRRAFVVVAGILAGMTLILALPDITGRPDVFESLFGGGGRFDVLRVALSDRSVPEMVFGRGVGLNTNAALNLLYHASPDSLGPAGSLVVRPTDSTVTGPIIQIGILGTLVFYGGILWAGLRDRSARIFYSIVALSSLTINITELFPVNFLLGFALAHSASGSVARRG